MDAIVLRILNMVEYSKLTDKEIVQKSGISTSSISAWRKGKANPSTDAIIKLAAFFQVSTDYLLTGKDWKPTLPPDDSALLDLFHELPPDKQAQFLIYLKGYVDGAK